MLRATTACTFSRSQYLKVVRNWCASYILTWKCASGHNGVHFLDISISEIGPRPSVFHTFDLEMCFAPERRALFRHLNFQKCSECEFFCIFTYKCASRHNGVYILSCKCASRHNGVHFFISRHLNVKKWFEPCSF